MLPDWVKRLGPVATRLAIGHFASYPPAFVWVVALMPAVIFSFSPAELAVLSEQMPAWLQLGHVEPWFAAVAGGLLLGAAFIILFRHRTSLGGLNVLVLWLQDRFGWRAGLVQGAIDLLILLAAVPWLDARRALWSIDRKSVV